LFRKGLVVGIIILFLATSISASEIAIQPEPIEHHTLWPFNVLAIGKIKDPCYTGLSLRFNFQVINITIIELFWMDLGVLYFGKFHLNNSWTGEDVTYHGINTLRMWLSKNPPETAFICGVLTGGRLFN